MKRTSVRVMSALGAIAVVLALTAAATAQVTRRQRAPTVTMTR